MALKRISKNHIIYKFTPAMRPVEKAHVGDIVVFETKDCFGEQIRDENVKLNEIDWNKVNPATGPLFVEEAEPGDTLKVEILSIRVNNPAIMAVAPGAGVLGNLKYDSKVKIVNVEKDFVIFSGLKVKMKPMIGVIGVAPKEGEYPTGTSDVHGGNMDIAELTAGTSIYFPVFVKGALLALGDLHAVQADGEICVTGAEASGEVVVRVDVIKDVQPKYPVLETSNYYAIIAPGKDLDEAVYKATMEAVNVLKRKYSLSFEEAYMLASLIVNLRINQVVDPRKGVRAEISKEYVSIEDFLS